jgi:hypothetical protein
MRDLDTIDSELRLLAAVGTRGGGGGGGLVEWLQTGRWAAARHQWCDTSPPAPGICMQRQCGSPGDRRGGLCGRARPRRRCRPGRVYRRCRVFDVVDALRIAVRRWIGKSRSHGSGVQLIGRTPHAPEAGDFVAVLQMQLGGGPSRCCFYDRLLSRHPCSGLWQRPECVALQSSW